MFVALDPGPFDPEMTPPAPNYAEPASWAALPTTEDGADISLPEHPAIDQRSAKVGVFYLHPTTWVGSEWNGPIDDPTVIEATTRGGTLIQASAFNACGAIYAPRYRQVNGLAYTLPDSTGEQAIDIAYADVSAAFAVFLEGNGGRPFILASHSQGSVLAARLFREEIYGKAPGERLVVAYMIGGPIRREDLGEDVPVCASATQTGCVVVYNARGLRYEPNGLEFNADQPELMDEWICVNPLTWTNDDRRAAASDHRGAIFFDAEQPEVLPNFADGQCLNGRLVITEMGEPSRDTMSQILDWMIGPENYHPFEYQLFYLDLRQNAVDRVAAFLGEPSRTAPGNVPD